MLDFLLLIIINEGMRNIYIFPADSKGGFIVDSSEYSIVGESRAYTIFVDAFGYVWQQQSVVRTSTKREQ